jgi:flagella basal body P-ring formation protein FlgA
MRSLQLIVAHLVQAPVIGLPVLCWIMVALALVMLLAGVDAADAATLRTMTTLHGPRVTLADLFDDAGPDAARVLGPGPAPGGRIVVEAPQLAAIARQFGVDWTPASQSDRAVLDWPGRPLPREAVLAAVREALGASGVDQTSCEIDLTGYSAPVVPYQGTARPLVSQLDYDRSTGRFSAVLSVTGDGMDPLNSRLAGRVDEMVALPVATSRLVAGTVLRAEDVHTATVPTRVASRAVAHDADDIVGQQLRHQVAPGQPFPLSELMRPTLVRRGANVMMELSSPGISLTAQGKALDTGAVGERIRVLNPISRAVIEADVIGPDRVRVAPGDTSLLATARANRSAGEVVVR